MQALGSLAVVHATFEEAWAKLENGDMLYADACAAMDDLAKAQQHEARLQDEVKGCRESLNTVTTAELFLIRVAFRIESQAKAGLHKKRPAVKNEKRTSCVHGHCARLHCHTIKIIRLNQWESVMLHLRL